MRSNKDLIVFMGESYVNSIESIKSLESAFYDNIDYVKLLAETNKASRRQLSKKLTKSSYRKYCAHEIFIYASKMKKEPVCAKGDYEQLKIFYDLFTSKANPQPTTTKSQLPTTKSSSATQVFIIDELIEFHLKETHNNKKELKLNVAAMLASSKLKKLKEELNDEAFVNYLCREVIGRIKEKTNFSTLKNYSSYEITICDYVKSLIDRNKAMNIEQAKAYESLSQEIDFNQASIENIQIKTIYDDEETTVKASNERP
jgi:nitrogen regulatory protein PII